MTTLSVFISIMVIYLHPIKKFEFGVGCFLTGISAKIGMIGSFCLTRQGSCLYIVSCPHSRAQWQRQDSFHWLYLQ